jgi:hypothetical protein
MIIVEHPLLTAAAIHTALQRELDWLRLAATVYESDRYQRLVGYSAGRLHYVLTNTVRVGCKAVRFSVDPALDPKTAPIEIHIEWNDKRSDSVIRAWSQLLESRAKV